MALIDAWLRLDSFEKKTLCLRLWKRKRRRISWLLGTCSFFDCLLSGPASARAALRLGRRKCGRRLPRGYLKRLGLEVERELARGLWGPSSGTRLCIGSRLTGGVYFTRLRQEGDERYARKPAGRKADPPLYGRRGVYLPDDSAWRPGGAGGSPV